jgi:hypothetical protein
MAMSSNSSISTSSVEANKIAFFHELELLDKSSDVEDDTNEPVSHLCSRQGEVSSSPPIILDVPDTIRQRRFTRVTSTTKKTRGLHQTISTPLSVSSIADTTQPSQKASLVRHDISIEVTPENSFDNKALSTDEKSVSRAVGHRRTVSTPTIGSVSMTHSLGITNMLKKNPRKESVKSAKGAKGAKRKADAVEMKPESERIFNDKIFYYIPDNDVGPLRKLRIQRAMSYGATWTKEWSSSITHIIVDSDHTFDEITKWLRLQKKVSGPLLVSP